MEYQRQAGLNGRSSYVGEESDISEFKLEKPGQNHPQTVLPSNQYRQQGVYCKTQSDVQENNAGPRSIFDTMNGGNFGVSALYSQDGTSKANSARTKLKPTPWDLDYHANPDTVSFSRQNAPSREPPKIAKCSPLSNMNALRGSLPDNEPNLFNNTNGTYDEWDDVPIQEESASRRPAEQRKEYNDFGDKFDNRGSRTAAASSKQLHNAEGRTATGSNSIPLRGQAFGFSSANTGARTNFGDKKVKREKYTPESPNATELFDDFYRIETGGQVEMISTKVTISGGDGKGSKIGVNSFEQMGLSTEILNNLKLKKIYVPLPIQKYVIPLVLKHERYSIIGNAETGSGKTIAFLLPITYMIQRNKKTRNSNNAHPYAVIIEPTRELAYQLFLDARAYATQTGVAVEVIYGEMHMSENIRSLRKGCDILITTLGRLVHFIERGFVSLDSLEYLVLDEADKLLRKENMRDIDKIWPRNKRHRTLLFSATYDDEVQQFLSDSNFIERDAYFIRVGDLNCVAKTVDQRFIQVHRDDKHVALLDLLIDAATTKQIVIQNNSDDENEVRYKPEKTIVFVDRKRRSDLLALVLAQKGFDAISLNSDRTPQQRWDAINKFTRGVYDVLVATDVAARGLNIPKVDHVINFHLPESDAVFQYNHRIGRTGRAGNVGHATSFFDPNSSDVNNVDHYIECLRQVRQDVPQFMLELAKQHGSHNFERDHWGHTNSRSRDWER